MGLCVFEKYISILALEMASPGNQHCANIVSVHYNWMDVVSAV